MHTLVHEQAIIDKVRGEILAQVLKWGEQNHPPIYWLAIIGEEYGEACKASLDDGGPEPYQAELIQLAACCISALDSIYRAWDKEQ